jgi:signal transduction histidine kinase
MFPFQLALYLPQIIGIIVIILLIGLSKSTTNQVKPLLGAMILMAIWLILQLLAQITGDSAAGLELVRASVVTSSLMAITYYFSILVYTDQFRKSALNLMIVIAGVLLTIIGLSDLAIQKTTANMSGISIDEASGWYYVMLVFTVTIFAYALWLLYAATKRLPKKLRKKNYILFISTVQVVALSGFSSIFFAELAAGQAIIFLSAFLFCVGIFLGIFRYKLFDIRLVVVRSVGYGLSIITLALVYFVIAYLLSILFFKQNVSSDVSVSPVNILLALVLAFIFQPIKRFFDRVTNFLFYRDVYNIEDFFSRFSRQLSTITDLGHLLSYASSEINTTLKASFGAFFIYRSDNRIAYTSTNPKHKRLPIDDARELDRYVIEQGNHVIITDFLTSSNTANIRRLLVSHKIALVLPIIQSNITTGYLFLGDHLSSQYTQRDIKVLETIADELTIAIQNALSVEAVKELNETLQQRVNDATKELRASNAQLRRLDQAKDEFVSMASHQLRTPLTSVKGYISMVMEGDVGKISDSQKHLLGEAFTSSERMVHLINDFLNVSRLQTGKFLIDKRPVDLAKLVGQEIDSLATTAASRQLTFAYKAPKNVPILNLDEGKMQQVIMNFADNALYYSTESTKIAIKLAVEGKDVVFTVKDTGIGVPKSEQSQLFSKFYRASNARKQRPDGTGVGLFLAKKVIDAHGGSVVFDSVEGKGSTFGFRLPIESLRAGTDTN